MSEELGQTSGRFVTGIDIVHGHNVKIILGCESWKMFYWFPANGFSLIVKKIQVISLKYPAPRIKHLWSFLWQLVILHRTVVKFLSRRFSRRAAVKTFCRHSGMFFLDLRNSVSTLMYDFKRLDKRTHRERRKKSGSDFQSRTTSSFHAQRQEQPKWQKPRRICFSCPSCRLSLPSAKKQFLHPLHRSETLQEPANNLDFANSISSLCTPLV